METEHSGAAAVTEADRPRYIPLPDSVVLVKGALVSLMAVDALAALTDLASYSLLNRAGGRGFLTDTESSARDFLLAIVLPQGAVFIVASAFFIAWFRRAYRNLPALGATHLRYRSWWTIGGWLIPIANLFRPKQIANDIWRGSDPDLPENPGEAWAKGRVPAVLAVWWGAYLALNGLYGAAGSSSGGWLTETTDLGQLETSSLIDAAANVVAAIACLVTIVVVDRVSRRQEARATRLGLVEPAPDEVRTDRVGAPLGKRTLRAVLGSGIAAFTALGAAIVLLIGSSAEPVDVGSAAQDSSRILFEDNFSDPGGWLIDDDESATFAYRDRGYQIVVKHPQETWYSFIELETAEGSLAVEADIRLRAGRPLEDSMGVGCLDADQQGYTFNVWGDGYTIIGRDPGAGRALVELSRNEKAARGDTARVRAECFRESGGQSTVLSLYLDGILVDRVREERKTDPFKLIALLAYSERGESDARFDNVLVTKP